MEFEWHCKSGLAENIQVVKQEFCEDRGLKPFKIFLAGPPLAGKSFFAKQLAEHYNVPHIHTRKLMQEIEAWNREKEEEYNKKQEIKRRKEEEEQKRLMEEERIAE